MRAIRHEAQGERSTRRSSDRRRILIGVAKASSGRRKERESAKHLHSILSGVAGEYFVAGELSRRGYLASITLRNTREIDLLAASADACRSVGIQVKTNQRSSPVWLLNQAAERIRDQNISYVFVNLNSPGGTPTYHVVPSATVAQFIADSHRKWLAGTRADGKKRKDTPMRKFEDPRGEFLNAWHLLGLD